MSCLAHSKYSININYHYHKYIIILILFYHTLHFVKCFSWKSPHFNLGIVIIPVSQMNKLRLGLGTSACAHTHKQQGKTAAGTTALIFWFQIPACILDSHLPCGLREGEWAKSLKIQAIPIASINCVTYICVSLDFPTCLRDIKTSYSAQSCVRTSWNDRNGYMLRCVKC